MTNTAPAVNQNAPAALKKPINFGSTGVQLTSFEDAYRFSKCVLDSGWAPKGFQTAEAVLIALQHAAELGLPPMAGLQNIAVINGKPGIYGDAALAIVRKSGLMAEHRETEVGTRGKDDWGYKVTTRRTDMAEPHSETFTVADAKAAGLWGKAGPWSQYPKRMLLFRARGFALRDVYGDVLKGLRTVEELDDMPMQNVTPQRRGLSAMIEGDPKGESVTQEQAAHVFNRDLAISDIERYLLDAGVSEDAILREVMGSKLIENADGLGLFELSNEDLSKVVAYVKSKAATTNVKES